MTELSKWPVPDVPPRLERRLRRDFQRRHRLAMAQLWAGRVAVAAVVIGTALLVRQSGESRRPSIEVRPPSATAVAAAGLNLAGFVPMARLRLARQDEAVTETTLDGFVPVGKMTLTKWEGRPQ